MSIDNDSKVHNVADDNDDAATAVILSDGNGPRLLVGNTAIVFRQLFDGLPELMLCFLQLQIEFGSCSTAFPS